MAFLGLKKRWFRKFVGEDWRVGNRDFVERTKAELGVWAKGGEVLNDLNPVGWKEI
jgi:hypothetical protein